jgi:hypothetical protein
MTGEGDGRERQAAASAKNSDKDLPGQDSKRDARQDRLKLALRENLKRRKSQARGRDELTAAVPDREEALSSSYREDDKADRE